MKERTVDQLTSTDLGAPIFALIACGLKMALEFWKDGTDKTKAGRLTTEGKLNQLQKAIGARPRRKYVLLRHKYILTYIFGRLA